MFTRLRALLRRAEVDREVEEEMRDHLARDIALNRSRGMTDQEAETAAHRAFGNLLGHTEAARDAWGWNWLEQLGQDLRYGTRALRRTPVFTLVAILSLALGIGSNTAIYGLIYNLLFQPLAVLQPRTLAVLVREDQGERDQRFSRVAVAALRGAGSHVKLTAYYDGDNTPVEVDGNTSFLNLLQADGEFFSTLGVTAARGRLIEPDDVGHGAPVVVLSARLAGRVFGSIDSAVGRTIRIRDQAVTVVGVTAPAFRGLQYPGHFDLAVPQSLHLALGLPDAQADTTARFTVVARVGDPATWREREGAMHQALGNCCPSSPGRIVLEEMTRGIAGGKDDMRPALTPILYALMGSVGVVLLIACANVGNLLLLRAGAREREITVRLSLGSSRGRIVRQLLTESLLLGGAGILLGLLLAAWTRATLLRSVPGLNGDYLEIARFDPTPRVIVFAVLVGLIAVLACGLVPALRATRTDLSRALRQGGRAGGSQAAPGLGRALVMVQVALTLVLLTTGALLMTTLRNLAAQDTGLGVEEVIGMGVETRGTSYEAAGIVPLYAQVLDAARQAPDVIAAGAATFAPLFGGRNTIVGVELPGQAGGPQEALFTGASPQYFTAAGIGLVAGRIFAEGDRAGSEPVIVIDEAVAGHMGGAQAIGQTLRLHGSREGVFRVVGVVRAKNLYGPRDGAVPAVYVPLAQLGSWPYVQLVVRMRPGALAATTTVAKAITGEIPGIRVRNGSTGQEQLAAWLLRELLAATLAGAFAVLALGLAALGLYGVIAYNVARRTGEIGIRIALGASRASVAYLVVRHAMGLVGTGFAIGIPLAFLAGQALGTVLFGVSSYAVLPVVLAALVLGVVGLAAAAIPASRAVRVAPYDALRHD